MTLKEKFENVEIMFENQTGKLKYDELCEAPNECVKIADEFAIGFAEWWLDKFTFKDFIHKESKELLEIFKKEKGF